MIYLKAVRIKEFMRKYICSDISVLLLPRKDLERDGRKIYTESE